MAVLLEIIHEQASGCLICGTVTVASVCPYCYEKVTDDLSNMRALRLEDLHGLAHQVDMIGDRIRDDIGDTRSWWLALRDVAADMRLLSGKDS